MQMPELETNRLVIRPFTMDDLEAIHRLYIDIDFVAPDVTEAQARQERQAWLEWTVLNYDALHKLSQPPYGDRAVVLKETNQFIGAGGLVPLLMPFGQLPSFGGQEGSLYTTEMGLFWAISPAHQRQGYATEVARALIDFAFTELRLKRIVANTDYDNAASLAVMGKVGMHIEKNPFPEPPWLQAIGILENSP